MIWTSFMNQVRHNHRGGLKYVTEETTPNIKTKNKQYTKHADTHTVLWSRRAERLGAYRVQMNHTLIEPLCRRELGWKCGQCHWRCWQAALFAPTPSEQSWQQWHLLWNSRSKVRHIMLQSECLANTHLLQVTKKTVNKANWNLETNRCKYMIKLWLIC
jgi:hypothetical protein